MDFYDRVDENYLNMIKRPMHLWRVKLELLDHYENTIKCIETDIDYSNAGSISGNNAQGTRKSCSVTLINVDLSYIPNEDSPFWFNRKFRLYIGLVDNRHYKQGDTQVHWTNEADTYWFPKGVYITSDIHVDSTTHTVTISGVDKYAQLDGSLNVLQADEMNTVFEYGASIHDVIQDILTLNMGNGQPLDPIEPMIDEHSLNTIYLYKEFTLSAGQYYGDFLNELATSYGAEVYYDNVGRLIFRRSFSDDFPYWIGLRAPALEVKYHLPGYMNPQESVKMTGINKIIVATDNVETPNASYTAVNNNPRSPLCFNKIGARTLPENGGVVIINAGNIVDEDDDLTDPTIVGEAEAKVLKRCRDYAEYRLMQETCLGTSISLNTAPYLHLNEGDVIAVTDPNFGLDCDLYIINSITFPLGSDSIQLEISNLGFLNSDLSAQTQYSGLANNPIKFGIHYITGEVTGTPPANQSIEIGENFTTATDYNEDTHEVSFERTGYELMNWKDNIHESTYELNTEYPMPHQHFTLTANWASVEDYMLEIRIKNVMGAGSTSAFKPLTNQDSTVFSVISVTVNDKKYYFWGRDFEPQSSISIIVDSTLDIKYHYLPISQGTMLTLNSDLDMLMASGTNGGQTYYLKCPNAIETITFLTVPTYMETIIFPLKCRTINLQGTFMGDNITDIDFNNDYELTINEYGAAPILCNCTNLQSVVANNHVIINLNGTGKLLTWNNSSAPNSLPNIDFAEGLRLNNSGSSFTYAFEVNAVNSIQRTINIGRSENVDPYKGGLELYTVYAFGSNQTYLSSAEITINSIYADNSYLFANATVGSLVLSGSVKACNNSWVFYYTSFTNSLWTLDVDNIYIDSSRFFMSTSGLSTLTINSDCYIFASYFIASCSSLTTVNIYGAVDIDCNNQSCNVFAGNSSLTDVYFYNDNVTITNDSNANIFTGNNANFKLHGVADGNVQAYATAHNIPFEVISDV